MTELLLAGASGADREFCDPDLGPVILIVRSLLLVCFPVRRAGVRVFVPRNDLTSSRVEVCVRMVSSSNWSLSSELLRMTSSEMYFLGGRRFLFFLSSSSFILLSMCSCSVEKAWSGIDNASFPTTTSSPSALLPTTTLNRTFLSCFHSACHLVQKGDHLLEFSSSLTSP